MQNASLGKQFVVVDLPKMAFSANTTLLGH